MINKNDITKECYFCVHKKDNSQDVRIQCKRPDKGMTGDYNAIIRGEFEYPLLFDPKWKTKSCLNFKAKV